ncbi:hypothetical protein O5D80_004250 [Batrachochytrium dendrobatidis]|nr:hypothetical protein O5D80_004250 [Batrachochytrium dendrobatidis]
MTGNVPGGSLKKSFKRFVSDENTTGNNFHSCRTTAANTNQQSLKRSVLQLIPSNSQHNTISLLNDPSTIINKQTPSHISDCSARNICTDATTPSNAHRPLAKIGLSRPHMATPPSAHPRLEQTCRTPSWPPRTTASAGSALSEFKQPMGSASKLESSRTGLHNPLEPWIRQQDPFSTPQQGLSKSEFETVSLSSNDSVIHDATIFDGKSMSVGSAREMSPWIHTPTSRLAEPFQRSRSPLAVHNPALFPKIHSSAAINLSTASAAIEESTIPLTPNTKKNDPTFRHLAWSPSLETPTHISSTNANIMSELRKTNVSVSFNSPSYEFSGSKSRLTKPPNMLFLKSSNESNDGDLQATAAPINTIMDKSKSVQSTYKLIKSPSRNQSTVMDGQLSTIDLFMDRIHTQDSRELETERPFEHHRAFTQHPLENQKYFPNSTEDALPTSSQFNAKLLKSDTRKLLLQNTPKNDPDWLISRNRASNRHHTAPTPVVGRRYSRIKDYHKHYAESINSNNRPPMTDAWMFHKTPVMRSEKRNRTFFSTTNDIPVCDLSNAFDKQLIDKRIHQQMISENSELDAMIETDSDYQDLDTEFLFNDHLHKTTCFDLNTEDISLVKPVAQRCLHVPLADFDERKSKIQSPSMKCAVPKLPLSDSKETILSIEKSVQRSSTPEQEFSCSSLLHPLSREVPSPDIISQSDVNIQAEPFSFYQQNSGSKQSPCRSRSTLLAQKNEFETVAEYSESPNAAVSSSEICGAHTPTPSAQNRQSFSKLAVSPVAFTLEKSSRQLCDTTTSSDTMHSTDLDPALSTGNGSKDSDHNTTLVDKPLLSNTLDTSQAENLTSTQRVALPSLQNLSSPIALHCLMDNSVSILAESGDTVESQSDSTRFLVDFASTKPLEIDHEIKNRIECDAAPFLNGSHADLTSESDSIQNIQVDHNYMTGDTVANECTKVDTLHSNDHLMSTVPFSETAFTDVEISQIPVSSFDQEHDKNVSIVTQCAKSQVENSSNIQQEIITDDGKDETDDQMNASQTTFTQFEDLISTQLLNTIQIDKIEIPASLAIDEPLFIIPTQLKSCSSDSGDSVSIRHISNASIDVTEKDNADAMDDQLLSTQILANIPLNTYTCDSIKNQHLDASFQANQDSKASIDSFSKDVDWSLDEFSQDVCPTQDMIRAADLAIQAHEYETLQQHKSKADSSFNSDAPLTTEQDTSIEVNVIPQPHSSEPQKFENFVTHRLAIQNSSRDLDHIKDISSKYTQNEQKLDQNKSNIKIDLNSSYKFASGKQAHVSTKSQTIGQALLLEENGISQKCTRLLRDNIDVSVTVPGTMRPLILRDVASQYTTKGCALNGNPKMGISKVAGDPSVTTASEIKPVSFLHVSDQNSSVSFEDETPMTINSTPFCFTEPIQFGLSTEPISYNESAQSISATPKNNSQIKMAGFTTGSGKPLAKLSNKALERANLIMGSVKLNLSDTFDKTMPHTSRYIKPLDYTSDKSAFRSTLPLSESQFTSGKKLDTSLHEVFQHTSEITDSEDPNSTTLHVNNNTCSPLSDNPMLSETTSKTALNFMGSQSAPGEQLDAPSVQARRRSARLFADLNMANDLPHKDITSTGNNFLHDDEVRLQTPDDSYKSSPAHIKKTLASENMSHWSTPKRPALGNRHTVSLSSLGRRISTQVHPSPKIAATNSTSSPMLNNPFKMPIIKTPLSSKMLHPNVKAVSAKRYSHGTTFESSQLSTAQSKPPFELYDLSVHNVSRPSLKSFSKLQWPLVSDLQLIGVSQEVITLTLKSASNYTFDFQGHSAARSSIIAAGANQKLANEAWVQNHYSLILWKLASLVRRFPFEYRTYLSFDTVVQQLKYRYEMEINKVRSSVIKQITEQDNVPGWHMILCVSEIFTDGLIELTDGWYCICAVLDDRLRFLTSRGYIKVGQKLHIDGAQLEGPLPTTPLEMTAETRLRLHANGVQRAKWYDKLGYALPPHITRGIKGLVHNGGSIGCLDVVVIRQYPIVYKERLPNMSYIYRSEREENKVADSWERRGQAVLQMVQQECFSECGKESEKYARDEKEFQDLVMDLFQERHPARIVVPILQVLVCDYPPAGVMKSNTRTAILTIPCKEFTESSKFSEGMRVKAFKVGCTSRDKSDRLKLSITQFSSFYSLPIDPARLAQTHYTPRQLVQADQLHGIPINGELDMITVVCLHIDWKQQHINGSSADHQSQRTKHTFLCCDTSQHLFVVDMESITNFKLNEEFAVVWMKNLEMAGFDTSLQMNRLRATIYSEFKLTGALQPFGHQPRTDLVAWRDRCWSTLCQIRDSHASLGMTIAQ